MILTLIVSRLRKETLMNADTIKKCKELCWSCRTHCRETLVHHCLEKSGEHVEKDHVKLMLDCIQMCQTAADFMDRHSVLHAYTCDTCATVCEACAESCERIASEHMK